MTAPFSIRSASLADAELIAGHRARMFHEMDPLPQQLLENLRAQSCQRLRDALSAGEYLGWLASPAELPNVIAGGAGLQLRTVLPHPITRSGSPTAIAEGRHGLILNVYTEPEWRRKGVAGLLLKCIVQWARNEQLDSLVLHASDKGRALYEQHGFVATKEMRLSTFEPVEDRKAKTINGAVS